MIDIHSHLLPCIDDGSKDLETTLKMIEIYKSQGVDKVIATPHYYINMFENTKEIIQTEVNKINNELKERNIDFEILPGSEVFATKSIINDIKEGIIQTLNNSRYILLEFDFKRFPDYGLDLIYELHLLGYRVIIAHPERYHYVIQNPLFLNEFINEGCLIQLNASSVVGLFGNEIKKLSNRIINNGSFNFIATDAHTTNGRGPYFNEAISIIEKYNKNFRHSINKDVEMLINNVEICSKLNKMKEKRTIFNIFKAKWWYFTLISYNLLI